MAKEFTTTPIRLMGQEFYFKRCPTETLRVYDEKLDWKEKLLQKKKKESKRK